MGVEMATKFGKADITELKAFANPPQMVKNVVTSFFRLLSGCEDDWTATKKAMGDVSRGNFVAFLSIRTARELVNNPTPEELTILANYSTLQITPESIAA